MTTPYTTYITTTIPYLNAPRGPGAVPDRDRRQLAEECAGRVRLRQATGALCAFVDAANRYVSQARPWELAKAERARRIPDPSPVFRKFG